MANASSRSEGFGPAPLFEMFPFWTSHILETSSPTCHLISARANCEFAKQLASSRLRAREAHWRWEKLKEFALRSHP